MVDPLVQAAAYVRQNAYVPYSGYSVGAAIEGVDGRVWTGVNFENVSYGATICAERSAVAKMVTDGGRQIGRLALITRDGGTPCGICLQVLSEFTPELAAVEILVANEAGEVRSYRLSDLLPQGFRSDEVGRTESTA